MDEALALVFTFAAILVLVVFYMLAEPRRFRASVICGLENHLVATLRHKGIAGRIPFRLVSAGTQLSKFATGDAGWLALESFAGADNGGQGCVYAYSKECVVSWQIGGSAVLVYYAPSGTLYAMLCQSTGADESWPLQTARIGNDHRQFIVLSPCDSAVVEFANKMIR